MAHLFSCSAGVVAIATVTACASYPEPVQRLASAESAARTAEEQGAGQNSPSQLHLRLAREQIARAKSLMNDGDYESADYVLIRAKADAELALAETQEVRAQQDAQRALQAVAQVRASSPQTPTSITVTTSATTTAPPPPPATRTTTTTTTTIPGGTP